MLEIKELIVVSILVFGKTVTEESQKQEEEVIAWILQWSISKEKKQRSGSQDSSEKVRNWDLSKISEKKG